VFLAKAAFLLHLSPLFSFYSNFAFDIDHAQGVLCFAEAKVSLLELGSIQLDGSPFLPH